MRNLSSVLPAPIFAALLALPASRRSQVQELRFRAGQMLTAAFPSGERVLPVGGAPLAVTPELLRELVDRATGFSPYALKAEVTGLYLPLPGGHRLGLCGTAVMQGGALAGLRDLSSVALRIARACPGIAEPLARVICGAETVESVLLVSPPGGGKTTLLRDLVRAVSDRGRRVCVLDGRGEIAAVERGVPQLDVGRHTDVLTGGDKRSGVELLLRVMNPEVIALDEITAGADLELVRQAAFCGVALFATAHAAGRRDLLRRPLYQGLLQQGVFRYLAVLEGKRHTYTVERLETDGEVDWRGTGGLGVPVCRRDEEPVPGRPCAVPQAAAVFPRTHAGGDGEQSLLRTGAV